MSLTTPELTAQLKKLCAKAETVKEASKIYHAIKPKTRPGSGYVVDLFLIGIPAICSYVASEELQNGDVKHDHAQKASSIKPKQFQQGVDFVRDQWDSYKDAQHESEPTSYSDIIREYRLSRTDAAVFEELLAEVDSEVAQKTGAADFDLDSAYAVFAWTCGYLNVQNSQGEVLQQVAKKHKSKKTFVLPFKALEDDNSALILRIQQKYAERTQPAPSPTKQATRASVSVSSPLTRTASKRKLESTNEEDKVLNDTPVKKSKADALDAIRFSTPRKKPIVGNPMSALEAALSQTTVGSSAPRPTPLRAASSLQETPSRRQSQRIIQKIRPSSPELTEQIRASVKRPSSPKAVDRLPSPKITKLNIDLGLVDEEDTQPKFRRRFRPIFVANAQWSARDPRAVKLWKNAKLSDMNRNKE